MEVAGAGVRNKFSESIVLFFQSVTQPLNTLGYGGDGGGYGGGGGGYGGGGGGGMYFPPCRFRSFAFIYLLHAFSGYGGRGGYDDRGGGGM